MIPRVDLVLLLGASAIVDRRDVIPSAVIEAGGAEPAVLGLLVAPSAAGPARDFARRPNCRDARLRSARSLTAPGTP